MPILAMTRLRLKSYRVLPRFLWVNEQAIAQLRTAPGFLRGKLLGEPNLAMWTATLWDSQESLRAFYLTGVHKRLMPELAGFACEAISGHIAFDLAELPPWAVIHEELCRMGRLSPGVSEPNENYRNRIIAPPSFTLLTRPVPPKHAAFR
jgi:hypothetical protein